MTDKRRAFSVDRIKRYPRMQPTSAVTLIDQNEFGVGHFIRDEQGRFNCLRREYADLEIDPTAPLRAAYAV